MPPFNSKAPCPHSQANTNPQSKFLHPKHACHPTKPFFSKDVGRGSPAACTITQTKMMWSICLRALRMKTHQLRIALVPLNNCERAVSNELFLGTLRTMCYTLFPSLSLSQPSSFLHLLWKVLLVKT